MSCRVPTGSRATLYSAPGTRTVSPFFRVACRPSQPIGVHGAQTPSPIGPDDLRDRADPAPNTANRAAYSDVINTGKKPLKLYTVYSPANHASGTVHKTKQDAVRAEAHAR